MNVRDPYADDAPAIYVRCLACGREVEKDWLVEHVVDECDGEPPYEDLEANGSQAVVSELDGAGGQAKGEDNLLLQRDAEQSVVPQEPAPAPSSKKEGGA